MKVANGDHQWHTQAWHVSRFYKAPRDGSDINVISTHTACDTQGEWFTRPRMPMSPDVWYEARLYPNNNVLLGLLIN